MKGLNFKSKSPGQPLSDESGRSKQRTYTDDFRWDVVRLITEERYSILAAARACGVSDQTVRNWYGRLAPAGDDANVDKLRAEVTRLRKQLGRAELERAIQEKATAYFAKDQL